MTKDANTTVALSVTEIKVAALKGLVQKIINDANLLSESLDMASKCTSIATTMFYIAAAERYTEKVKEDICHFVTYAKDRS